MLKTLKDVKAKSWVAHVDDERAIGNSIIVTLKNGFEFCDDPGCGVKGFDTLKACKDGTVKSKIQEKKG